MVATFCWNCQLFCQRFLLTIRLLKLYSLLLNNAFQLNFWLSWAFCSAVSWLAGHRALAIQLTACCLPQPYKPTPAARAIAIATALRINAVLFLLFFLLRQVVTWCPRPPQSLQPRRRFFLVPSLWLPVMRVIVMPVKAHRCQRYRRP